MFLCVTGPSRLQSNDLSGLDSVRSNPAQPRLVVTRTWMLLHYFHFILLNTLLQHVTLAAVVTSYFPDFKIWILETKRDRFTKDDAVLQIKLP